MTPPRSSLTPDFFRPPFAPAPEARFEAAPADGVLPEGFFSTSNLPTCVRLGDGWRMPRRAEPVAMGLAEDGSEGICVDQTEFVVSKLKDRGTHNPQDFMRVLRSYVDKCRQS